MYKKAKNFILYDIWRIPLRKHPPRISFIIKQLRIFILSIRGFTEDKVQLRASALTFFSVLSVVPVVAMILGIAKGFGFEELLTKEITRSFSAQKEVMLWILDFAGQFLSNIKGGFIIVGIVLLFWSVIKVFSNIESSFNDIWQIKKSRNFARKFSDYISIMLIASILIIASSSLTVFVKSQIDQLSTSFSILEYVGPFIFFLLKALPLLLIWLLFTIIYMVMPNTKVDFKYALIAGILAGTMFQVLQWSYINLQVGVSRYNAIYGSFAALPLFLIWLQYSWLIVLFGAEVSFAYQNIENYEYETESLTISHYYKKILSFLIAHLVVKRFENGEKPLTSTEISQNLEIPLRLVRDIVFELVECKIFSEVTTDSPKEQGYQPAMDINKITTFMVNDKLDKLGSEHVVVAQTSELTKLTEMQKQFVGAIEKSPGNKPIKDI